MHFYYPVMHFYYPVMLFYFSGDIVNILVKKSGDLKIFLSAEYHLSGENNPVKFKKNPVTKELILLKMYVKLRFLSNVLNERNFTYIFNKLLFFQKSFYIKKNNK